MYTNPVTVAVAFASGSPILTKCRWDSTVQIKESFCLALVSLMEKWSPFFGLISNLAPSTASTVDVGIASSGPLNVSSVFSL